MFDEDLAIKTKLGISDDSVNFADVIKAYAEAKGTEIDYAASFANHGGRLVVDKTGDIIASRDSCDNVVIGIQDQDDYRACTIDFCYNVGYPKKEILGINGEIYFPETNSVLMADNGNIDYYNSDSCTMACELSNLSYLKDSDNHNLGFAVELVKSIKNNDFIKPDKSFETDIQHFAETFKEATELVKAPEAKHM